jgi:hypothetical protein
MDVIQEQERIKAEKRALQLLIAKEKRRIMSSSLAYFPCLIQKRLRLQESLIENVELPRKLNSGYKNHHFPESVRSLQKMAYTMENWKVWIQYIYEKVFTSQHPISKLNMHFPLCFWVSMTRELRYIRGLLNNNKEKLPKLISQAEEDISKVKNISLNQFLSRLTKGRTKRIRIIISSIEGYVSPQLKTSESILSRQLNLCNFEKLLPFDLIPVVCSYL